MMRWNIIYVILFGFMGDNLYASIEVPVMHPSCKYTVQYPEGWDTIPSDTIKNKLNNIEFDLGLYPVSQEYYFKGNYVLIGFMPVIKTLSSFTFNKIVEDVTALNKQSEFASDTMAIRFNKIIPDARNYCIHSYFSIRKDSVVLENCQSLYLAKFGYITILSYRKTGAIPLDEMLEQLNDLIRIHPDYQYVEPPKEGITFRHLLVSLVIGLLVYVLISKFTQKRVAS